MPASGVGNTKRKKIFRKLWKQAQKQKEQSLEWAAAAKFETRKDTISIASKDMK